MYDDGLILMYVKNGTIYPVAMTQEQWDLLRIIVPIAILDGKINLIDKPQGQAVNMLEESEE